MVPKRLERKVVYESDWVNLYLDKVLFPDGRIIEDYHMLHFDNDSVGVVILNEKGEILLIKSSRYTTQEEEWEIIAGGVEKGESHEEAAVRECMEESGYRISNIKFLCKEYVFHGQTDKVHYIYQANAIEDERGDLLTPEEIIMSKWYTKNEIKEMIQNHNIHDDLSLIGLLIILCDM